MSEPKEITWPACKIVSTGDVRCYIEFTVDPGYQILRVVPDEEFNRVSIVLEPRKNSTEVVQ